MYPPVQSYEVLNFLQQCQVELSPLLFVFGDYKILFFETIEEIQDISPQKKKKKVAV